MSLYQCGKIWYLDLIHPRTGKRIRKSTGTSDKVKAKQLHDKLQADLWEQKYLGKEPDKAWLDAVAKWVEENRSKKSLKDDLIHLKWIDSWLIDKNKRTIELNQIDEDLIQQIKRARENTGVSPATVNHTLQVIRAIMRKAHKNWKWITSVPEFEMCKLNNKRIRWLTAEQANRLLANLPFHLKSMARFTLGTGLRASNVTGLKWSKIDFSNQCTYVSATETKNRKLLFVPFNEDVIKVLNEQPKVSEYVFTYKDNPITQVNTKAWRKALNRAGIEDFRWHDLRHTWASWHVQNGTSLLELKELAGWNSIEMALRYAHLCQNHLQNAANRITVIKMTQSNLKLVVNER